MTFTISILFMALAVFSGRAGQTGIYYICGIIVPSLVFLRTRVDRDFLIKTFYLALSLMGICLVFSVSNFLNEHMAAPDFAGANFARPFLTFSQKLESQLSSSIFFTGAYLGTWAVLKLIIESKFTTLLSHRTPTQVPNFSAKLDQFLFISSCLLGVYIVVQVLTGFDFRSVQAHRPDHRYASGLFRAEGFYSHPLTLASVCLAFFGFYWTLFWNSISQRKIYLGTALVHLFCVFASGGRIAVLIAIGAFVAVPVLSRMRKLSVSKIIGFLLATLISASALLYATGIWERFVEVFSRGDERSVFWKVYWQLFLDRPWFGHGHSWIPFYRDAYYKAMGFGDLERKYNAHNIYLQTLADAGVVGFVLICIFAGLIWRLSNKLIGDAVSPAKKTAINVAVVLNLLHGVTQNTLFDSGVTFVYLNLFIVMYWCGFAIRSKV